MRRQQNITQQTQVRTRLAPTPSGYLHLGNALSFAVTWALARQRHGTVILRIDDLDNARFRPEYLQDIFDTLHFMGLDYDEGPADAGDFLQHYSQHLRLPAYEHLLGQLVAKGVVYACPCSRKQLASLPAGADGRHACQQERLPLYLPDTAWRIQVPPDTEIVFSDLLQQECRVPLAAQVPDFVVRRKEGLPAYQIASLADDLEMGINLIVRGADLLASTAAQLFLARQLGADGFTSIAFLHHPVVADAGGGKLSKSHDSLSIAQMRRSGLSSKVFWQVLAATLGWEEFGIVDARSFLDKFRLENLPLPTKYGLQVSGYN
ncbi:glutamate--tRNA ligase family protein [Pontibacter akesuensis]|uniref:Glutamyl-tRNA synthetase n=1 Tax=Pontibacter akesuensis TaxID=388950 RepID=A0A1I7IFC9_9BACT|nr:glutamate--tRNA ligase family protein [Pontibacter akesuensis]GHA66938.1 glutamyl-Q tRNA(Asp) synthetase [Pontibacter akesuensis]SFU71617.1 glutamyl-tRNA synthetase [Pontibacter akesuensis]